MSRLLLDWSTVNNGCHECEQVADNEAVKARNMITEVEHPACGPMKLVSPPVKFSEANPSIRSPPPTLGQHTQHILSDLLGMDGKEIEKLKSDGVVA